MNYYSNANTDDGSCIPFIYGCMDTDACNFDSTVRLVNSTRLDHVKEGPERRIATLSEVGADAFNMHFSEWNEALVSLCHRFQIRSFAWDSQEELQIKWLFSIGIDGVFSDHVKKMTRAWERYKKGD